MNIVPRDFQDQKHLGLEAPRIFGLGEGVYLTVYLELSPNTDSIEF